MDVDNDCRVYDVLFVNFFVLVICFGFLKVFMYLDFVFVIDNFSLVKIIGDGGFGMVYKVKLVDGIMVVIKKFV